MAVLRPLRTSQPQGPLRIDWSNPLTRGLIGVFVPGVPINLVDGVSTLQNYFGNPTLGQRGSGVVVSAGAYGYPAPASASAPGALRFDLSVLSALVISSQDVAENNNASLFRGNGSSAISWAVGIHGGTYNGAFAVIGTFSYAPSVGGPFGTTPQVVLVTGDGATAKVYRNGLLEASGSYTAPTYEYSTARQVFFGSLNQIGTQQQSRPALGLVWNRALSAAESVLLTSSTSAPWQIFAPVPARVWLASPAGSPGSVAVFAQTFGAMTSASAAAIADTANASISFNPMTLTGTATLGDAAVASILFGPLALVATSSQADTGTATIALGPLVVAGAATLLDTSAAAITFGPMALAGAAALLDAAVASIALGPLSAASTATQSDTGTVAITLGPLSAASTAALLDAAVASITLGPLSAASTAALLDAAVASITFGSLGLASNATSAITRQADAAITFGPMTASAAAALLDAAAAAVALGPFMAAGTATLADSAALAIALGALTLASQAALAETGAASILLKPLSLASTAFSGNGSSLSAQHAAWLEILARAEGVIDSLVVNNTARSDGTLVQTVGDDGTTTTVTTTAAPSGAPGLSALTATQAGWLEALVRLRGGIAPLRVTDGARGDGTFAQSITQNGTDTIVTRTA